MATNPRRIPVIGLTGAIGAGKSTVADALRELGAVVHDADREVATLLEEPAVIERIGREVAPEAAPAGRIDRQALARVVFRDETLRRRLEAILHPPVVEAARRLIETPPPDATAIVLDAPLLLEAGMDRLCDAVWFVDAPTPERLRRVRARGWDEGELARREAAQLPVSEKRRRATRVIVNDGSLADLRRLVRQAFRDHPGERPADPGLRDGARPV